MLVLLRVAIDVVFDVVGGNRCVGVGVGVVVLFVGAVVVANVVVVVPLLLDVR